MKAAAEESWDARLTEHFPCPPWQCVGCFLGSLPLSVCVLLLLLLVLLQGRGGRAVTHVSNINGSNILLQGLRYVNELRRWPKRE